MKTHRASDPTLSAILAFSLLGLALAPLGARAQGPTVTELAWDPGLASEGTEFITRTSVVAEDAFFRLQTQNTAVGAWRTALRVHSGEASLYLRQGGLETDPSNYLYVSDQVGSDGLVLHSSEFQAAQEWHLLVRAAAGTHWTLFSGEAFVQDLGDLRADDTSGSGPVTIGPEGICYFKTTVPSDTLAWRLWLNGLPVDLYVLKSAAPVPRVQAFDLRETTQMLVVPDYLDTATFNGSYFIGVPSAPGTVIELDSRQQAVTDIAFASTGAPVTLEGYGYATYRVQVPVEQIAWQIDVVPLAGDPSVAVRREKVPNQYHNEAFSEVPGTVIDSLTLVPPTLSDGTFYVTVYGSGPFSFQLKNRSPEITPAHYVGSVGNTELNRVGWRFFSVSDLSEQLGTLGWYLHLQNAPPDTQIAIRRNAVPGLWNYRFMEAPDYAGGGYVDAVGTGLLQEPGHQADIWYVGVYNPQTPLDHFTLVTEQLTARPLDFIGGVASNANLLAPRVDYYAVTIPNGTTSWQLKLTARTEDVRLLVLKDELPRNDAGSWDGASSFVPPGRLAQKPGNEHFVLQPRYYETQLPPGTYYVGVGSDSVNPSSYTLESIGPWPITRLGTVGAADLTHAVTLEGGEVKAYQFEVPAGLQLAEIRLEDRVGQPVMALTRGTSLAQTRGDASPLGSYGGDGGAADGWVHGNLLTLANPVPGTYSLAVKATTPDGLGYPDASCTIRLHSGLPLPVGFNNSRTVVAGHLPGTWRFFEIEVPADTLGWDLRLIDVVGGDPYLLVRRDLLPELGLLPGPGGEAWPSGAQWVTGTDWTGYSLNPDDTSRLGRTLAVGLGGPLEPGTYYVGVLNYGTANADYTLWSRGIGASFTIPVQPLAFANGTALIEDLPAGEAAYFRVTVPPNTPSWKANLVPERGEALLVAQKDVLPSIACGYEYSPLGNKGGKLVQKLGPEHFLLLPPTGEAFVPSGDYFLAVVSEGENPAGHNIGTGTGSAQLRSLGALPVISLGALSTADVTSSVALEGGEVQACQFTVAAGVPSLEVRLENLVGHPALSLRAGAKLPQASDTWTLSQYGADGGEPYQRLAVGTPPVTVANPPPGLFSLIVKAAPSGDTFPDAAGTIRVRRLDVTPLTFEGGRETVSEQGEQAWRYFRFAVPANTLGWDLRLLNVSGGLPRLWICRDELPDPFAQPALHAGYLTTSAWPSGHHYAVFGDWTPYAYWPDGSPRSGQVFGAGLGHPLEPGTYYVGIQNEGTAPTSYTVSSRGVGAGYNLPVQTLSFQNGLATHDGLPAGEVAYYRVDVPAGTASWKVKLTPTRGDACLLVQQGTLPNIDGGVGSSVLAFEGGRVMQKSGNEHFALLPAPGETSLVAGSYYLAVVSDGINSSGETIGAGDSQFTLASLGPVTVSDLGPVSATDLVRAEALEGGEVRLHQFSVPDGLLNLEVRLEDQVGRLLMSLRLGDRWPSPGWLAAYGQEGGETPSAIDAHLITLPNPAPGTYSLMIKATADETGQYADATYTLRVSSQATPSLNFAESQNTNGLSHVSSGVLADRQSQFYRVMVPAEIEDAPVIGWQLDLAQTQGSPWVRVRKDALPSDGTPDTSAFVPNMANIVAPLLAPGTWFVEVRGEGFTEYTLTSRPLALRHPAWAMPAAGQLPDTPGLTPPEFGDSGIDPNGQPIEPPPSDLGIDLAQGDFDYYAVQVPAGNGGLMRVQLQAISGNPDLYVRVGNPPTRSHGQIGWFGVGAYDGFLNGTGTEYGNFVPTQGRLETELTPGLWYFAVEAAGASNVRYRLKFSTGKLENLPLIGGALADQTLAAGDWRYYRVAVPLAAPTEWQLTFSQQVGDVVMKLRDTLPPGQALDPQVGSFDVDWSSDLKNAGPYPSFDEPGTHRLTTPPLRPGAVYFVGFRATTDARFSVSSAATGTLNLAGILAFYGGTASGQLPPQGQAVYRVDVPSEATRWQSDATHQDSVVLHLEQGTVPQPPATHYSSDTADSEFRQPLDLATWPWQPGQSYFLLVTNTSGSAQSWSITVDGRKAQTEDDDADGLFDVWERQYFGDLNAQPGDDPDDDGLTNLEEFEGGTNPTVSDAVPITLDEPQFLPDGQLQILVTVPPNTPYRIQATDDLRAWTTVASGTGSGVYTDTTALTLQQRFYRVVVP